MMLLYPGRVFMSGIAGATYSSKYFSIFLNSNKCVSPAKPPGYKGNYTADYFRDKNKRYECWLKRAASQLNQLFQDAISQEKMPIVEFHKGAPLLNHNPKSKAHAVSMTLEKTHGHFNAHFYLKITATKSLSDREQKWLLD